jgi:hypothetical protein
MEFTLFQFGVKSNLPKLLQNQTYMTLLVLHGDWENEDVINVTYHKIIQVLMKDIVYKMLENNRCVNKTKWHHNIFKMAIMDFECCLPFIALSNVHQVVCSM